ncbi:hypothetical protein B0T16DRAFT_431505 [Cercophora newfieldiana]|uniref:Mitochondrial intermembrane space import and assembly protein 40 n=1 Tax=Cercophora newfieldiana TaxID=92897 RepID=A0AA39XZH9_9PEZI|nr:hypothetical protein B0T16DRAFT_431505 [Cercophora newfieldiana]
MYRAALRPSAGAIRAIRPSTLNSASRRLLSTSAAANKGTWKGTGLRWGLAIAAVYYYNTSPIFADELPLQSVQAPAPFSDADQPTIDALIEEKRKQTLAAAPPPPPAPKAEAETATTSEHVVPEGAVPEPGSPEALEQEAEQQGAFNPETGEINWDCPCLGGMAHGPCGEEFKSAFSCFVYSTDEPKGMDCIEKFQGMQDCFRKYPEIYGAEIDGGEGLIEGDEETYYGEAGAPSDAGLPKDKSELPSSEQAKDAVEPATPEAPVAKAAKETKETEETVVPEKAFDATEANKGKEQ